MGDYNNRMAELNLDTTAFEVNEMSAKNNNNSIGKRSTTDMITPVIEEGQFTDAVDQEEVMSPTTANANDRNHHQEQQHDDTQTAGEENVNGNEKNKNDDDTNSVSIASVTSVPATANGVAHRVDDDDDDDDVDQNNYHDNHQLSSNLPVEDPASTPLTAGPTASPLKEQQQQQQREQDKEVGGEREVESFRPVEVEITPAQPPLPVLPPAPVLRVEQLREEDYGSSPSSYTSEEEGYSFPEFSDDPEEREKLPEFVEPSEELQEKIVNQVEFYFSDANILKDAFLLKHVRRNKQGFVSLKLLTSFRKVKTLSKDYRVVAYSLQKSKVLEVNEEGTKVRRIDSLPEYDETTPSRTVVVVNLPIKNPAIENVAELFSKCGVISLIRILRPKGSIPPDIKKFSSKHPEIGTTLCAVIEFETFEGAKQACAMHNADDWRSGMRVVQLSAKKKEKDKKKAVSSNNNNAKSGSANSNSATDKEIVSLEDKKKKKGCRKKKRIDELCREPESSCYSSGSEADTPQTLLHMPSLDPSKLSPVTTPKPSPRSTPKSSPRTQRRKWMSKKSPLAETDNSPRISPQISPESLRKKYDNSDAPASPWVQRRLKAAQAQQNSTGLSDDKNGQSAGRSPKGSPLMLRRGRLHDLEMAVRSPKGPDGTSGFYGGMGRGKVPSNIALPEIVA
ncbi:la-related protein 6-like [Octopus vulgaris]|uniref:La-related protein 6-like n=1 Tax=Octopus vulgaris TaxID=6645 RepID=A0AA36FDB0_OCTVU|nr:la-related protein 6-like [Octopus vulgaris]